MLEANKVYLRLRPFSNCLLIQVLRLVRGSSHWWVPNLILCKGCLSGCLNQMATKKCVSFAVTFTFFLFFIPYSRWFRGPGSHRPTRVQSPNPNRLGSREWTKIDERKSSQVFQNCCIWHKFLRAIKWRMKKDWIVSDDKCKYYECTYGRAHMINRRFLNAVLSSYAVNRKPIPQMLFLILWGTIDWMKIVYLILLDLMQLVSSCQVQV